MFTLSRCLVSLALPVVLAGSTAHAQRATPTGECVSIGGLPSVATTSDEGLSWAVSRRPMRTGEGTFGLAAVRGRDELIAEYQGQIHISTTGGCSWRRVGTISGSPLRLVGTTTGAYAWSLFSARGVWRIDLDAPPARRIVRVADLPEDVIGMGTDPLDGDHVRAFGRQGGLYDSTNGGASWRRIGRGAPVTGIVYFAAFDPADLDHVSVGLLSNGVETTLDGGQTWTNAAGLTRTGGGRNTFTGVFSPVDSSVLWVQGIDLDESLTGHPSGGRHVYRSDDGGLSFRPVVDQGGGVVLVNGPTMAADPLDPDVLHFTFGASTFGILLELYRYDDVAGTTTWTTTTTTPHAKIRAMAFAPSDPARLVAGFEGS